MKSGWLKIKKLPIFHRYDFYALHLSLLRGCLCVCITLLLFSCASVPKNKTYLNTTSLSGISKVKVLVSVNTPEVKHAINSSTFISRYPFELLLYPSRHSLIALAKDHEAGSGIREQVNVSRLEESMAQSFVQPLIKASCFETVDYVMDKDQNNRKLSTAKYDAVVRLSVREISIRTFAGDNVKIHALVHGQMENLHSGDILWDREEYVSSSDPQPISFYKEHGLKELDDMLEKAAKRLANDFIYRK
jgi:hypothetical protein